MLLLQKEYYKWSMDAAAAKKSTTSGVGMLLLQKEQYKWSRDAAAAKRAIQVE